MTEQSNRQRRQRQIQELLAGNGRLSALELTRRLDVTTMTIRRDLAAMEAKGILLRVHGGCVLQAPLVQELSFSQKALQHRREKLAIARKAASLLKPHTAVYLDTGTTAACLARLLPTGLDLRVFTNNLGAAMELFGRRDVKVHVYGGSLAAQSPDLVGHGALGHVPEFRAEWAVLGADAIDLDTGELYAADLETAELSRAAQRQANRVMVLATSSKLGRRGMAVTGRLRAGLTLITGCGATAPIRRKLSHTGARIFYA